MFLYTRCCPPSRAVSNSRSFLSRSFYSYILTQTHTHILSISLSLGYLLSSLAHTLLSLCLAAFDKSSSGIHLSLLHTYTYIHKHTHTHSFSLSLSFSLSPAPRRCHSNVQFATANFTAPVFFSPVSVPALVHRRTGSERPAKRATRVPLQRDAARYSYYCHYVLFNVGPSIVEIDRKSSRPEGVPL